MPWYYTKFFVYIYACSVSRGALSFLLWRARLPQSAVFYNKFFNIHSGMVLRRVWALIFPTKKIKVCLYIDISAVIMCRRIVFFFPIAFIPFSHFHILQFSQKHCIPNEGCILIIIINKQLQFMFRLAQIWERNHFFIFLKIIYDDAD